MLPHLYDTFGGDTPLRVFKYITFRSALAFMLAWGVAMWLTPWFIRTMKAAQFGQQIRNDGPETHLSKKGTPTAGGIVILIAFVLAVLLCSRLDSGPVWVAVIVTLGFGAIGFVDDWLKFSKRNSAGLSGRYKLLGQAIIGVGVLWWAFQGFLSTDLALPFVWRIAWEAVPLWLYLPFCLFILVGASNAVNLTDGLDGLMLGPVIMNVAVLAMLAYLGGHRELADYLGIAFLPGSGELAVSCAAMAGACLGLLWYNAHPAQLFMGDVGSLSLGGFIGAIAVLTKNEVVLAILGGLFVAEAMSVILQVGSFKLRGKRLFRMAPFHHHLEKRGWHEPKVVVRLWIVSLMLAAFTLATLKLRFNIHGGE